MLNDGLLDVSYVMNLPAERITDLLKAMGSAEDLETMADCWGSLRVPWLEVECKDGLQVGQLHDLCEFCGPLSMVALMVSRVLHITRFCRLGQ